MSADSIKNNSEGVIRISDDVILVIAAKEISTIKNVVGLYSPVKQGFGKLKINSKSVRTDIKDKKVKIDMDVTLKYGAVIADIASVIQERVTKAVESMTGLTVEAVNVFVKSIEFPDDIVGAETEESL